jgi:hypothetical protein
MKEGTDYKFRDDMVKDDYETVPIEILIPKYENVIYRYVTVGISEDPEKESATMKFSFEIMKHPLKWNGHDFEHDPIFTQIVGTILNTLILDLNPVDRTDNTQKPDNE